MGLFNRYKSLGEYKIREEVNRKRTPLDIDNAREDKCKILFEDGNYQYLLYIIDKILAKSCYLLKREKNNKGRIIYLGSTLENVCYCNGKLFYVSPYAISMHDHSMTMIDGITGERQEIDFLGQEKVLGLDPKHCNDKIKNISSNNDCIVIYVLRKKMNDPQSLTNPFNEDLTYNIEIIYQNGLLRTKLLSTDSIVKKGPWPKSKIVLPPPPYTEADLDLLYGEYGKEAVDEALRIKEMYE